MASNMIVPQSRHTLFMRGFRGHTDMDKIRDFFIKEGGRCTFDFFKQSDDKSQLFVALRFDSKEVARTVLNRFDNKLVLGSRIQITWFRDHRRARAKEATRPNGRWQNNFRYNPVHNIRARYNPWRRAPSVIRSASSRIDKHRKSTSRSSSRSHSDSQSRSRSRSHSRSPRSGTWSRSRSRDRSTSREAKDRESRSPERRSSKKDSYDRSPGGRDRDHSDDYYDPGEDISHHGDVDMRSKSPNSNRYSQERHASNQYSDSRKEEHFNDKDERESHRYSDQYGKFEDPLAKSRWADDRSPTPDRHSSEDRSRSRDRMPSDRSSGVEKSPWQQQIRSPDRRSLDRSSDRKESIERSPVRKGSRYDRFSQEKEAKLADQDLRQKKNHSRSKSPEDDDWSPPSRRRTTSGGNREAVTPKTPQGHYEDEAASPMKRSLSKEADRSSGGGFSSIPQTKDSYSKVGGSVNLTLRSGKAALKHSIFEQSDSDKDGADKAPIKSQIKSKVQGIVTDGKKTDSFDNNKSYNDALTDPSDRSPVEKNDPKSRDKVDTGGKGKSLFEKYKASMRMTAPSKKDGANLSGDKEAIFSEDQPAEGRKRLSEYESENSHVEAKKRKEDVYDEEGADDELASKSKHLDKSADKIKSQTEKGKRIVLKRRRDSLKSQSDRNKDGHEQSNVQMENSNENNIQSRDKQPDQQSSYNDSHVLGRVNAFSDSADLLKDTNMLGLDVNKMKLVQERKKEVEQAYRQDCETFSTVVKMLISKDVALEDKLQHSLKENLEEIGQRCIQEVKTFIDQIKNKEMT